MIRVIRIGHMYGVVDTDTARVASMGYGHPGRWYSYQVIQEIVKDDIYSFNDLDSETFPDFLKRVVAEGCGGLTPPGE